MKMFEFQLNSHWNLYRVNDVSGNDLAPDKQNVITWTVAEKICDAVWCH